MMITDVVNCFDQYFNYEKGDLFQASGEHVGTLFDETWKINIRLIGSRIIMY